MSEICVPFGNFIFYEHIKAHQLRRCPNTPCRQRRLEIDHALPVDIIVRKEFRDWVLSRIACLITYYESGQRFAFRDNVERLFAVGLDVFRPRVDVEIYEIAQWSLIAEAHLELKYLEQAGKSREELEYVQFTIEKNYPSQRPYDIYRSAIQSAEEHARRLGICRNRLWNVVSGSPRAEFDLPAILLAIQASKQAENFRHEENLERKAAVGLNHSDCTSDICHFSSLDSTRVLQLHKCKRQDCKVIRFPLSAFDKPHARFTWWSSGRSFSRGPKVIEGRDYVAISHVWSDGTGGGVGMGRAVNECLFEYFRDITEELGCKALWWDTISVPTERKMRATALKKMHINFQDAKFTVVHDNYTVNYPWTNDGTPCIALALSPWFSRGWTALELMVSRNVKVIFRDPLNKEGYVIKDLETEVLAQHPAYCSRGHWIASGLIRDLRNKKVKSLTSLSRILKTRSTSWPRDRFVIAALLTGMVPDAGDPNMQVTVTQDIVKSFPLIDSSFLLHGQPTIADWGPFCWCPSNIFSEAPQTDSPLVEFAVDQASGAVISWFIYQLIAPTAIPSLQPLSSHLSVRWKIQAALTDPQHCILLWMHNIPVKGPAILARVSAVTVGRSLKEVYLDCYFIGVVYGPDYELDSPDLVNKLLHVRFWPSMPAGKMTAADLLDEYSTSVATVFPKKHQGFRRDVRYHKCNQSEGEHSIQ